MKKKKAILYVRVSTDEQAEKGYSLPAQQLALEKYCKSNNIDVAKVIQDDYSAWDGFDRPGYKILRQYLAANKNSVDYLLVTQWSRFSRNMTSSLNEIKFLKNQNIEPNAIEQFIDFTIPESQYMLAMYLVAPQVENDRLSIRTADGMRQGVKQGRWLLQAPKGYKNNKITKYIEVDEIIAPIVKWCFDEYAKGIYTAEEVRHNASKKGLILTKQGFLNMLANPLYIGKIFLKAYKDEPEQLIQAVHEPIVDDQTFNKVQYVLKGKSKPNKCIKEDNQNALHLRGLLICPYCGKLLTGGFSKGNGGIYPYYHCQAIKYNCKVSFRAEKAHAAMEKQLRQYEPSDEVVEVFKKVLTDIYFSKDKDKDNQKNMLEDAIKKVEANILKVENDYFNDLFTAQQYTALTKGLEDKKNELVMQLITISKVPANFDNYLLYGCNLIKNISYYYANSIPSAQNKLIGLIFPEKITFTGIEYKTTKTNEVLSLICSMDKGFKKTAMQKMHGCIVLLPLLDLNQRPSD